MKKGKKKDSDNEDSESDQKNHNNKSKKWWLNQSKSVDYNLKTHWNVSGKNEKTKKKSDNSDEESSEDNPKPKQKSPFDPPSDNMYQLMTVCNQNKRKKITKQSKINVDDDTDDDDNEKKIHINKKSKDFLFSKTTSKKRIEEESETESSDNNYVKVQRTPKSISFNSNSIQNEKHSERKSRNSQMEKKSRNSVTQPAHHSERKSRDYSIHKERPPERKLKIDFLESLDSDSTEKSNKNSHRKQQLISINKEEICSFYHISDYRIPNNGIFNNSAKPLNLKIIENSSHPKFNEELADAEIRLFPNQFDQFFEIVTNHLRTNPNDTKLCMKLLIAVDSVLYYDQAFESLTKSSIIDFLPFSTAKLIILSFKILKLTFMFRPNFFGENFMSTMKHIISILPVEMTLSLFIIYAHSFEYIENPWPLLDLLIKEKAKFFHQNDEDEEDTTKLKVKKFFHNDPDVEADFIVDDTDESFLSLLFFLNSNFKVYKQHRLKYCRSVFIESMFDPMISKKAALTAYKAVISLYDSDFGDQIGISSLFNDLKDSDFEDFALQILAKMNVDSIPIKNKYILQLINSSHVNEKASLILQKMMSNSQRNGKIASILLDNSKWLKFGLPTFSHTLMIFQSCVRFGNQSLLNNVKNCEEIPLFFKELVHSDNINDIQQIPQLIQDIEFDDFKSLSEISFFDSLLDKISNEEDEDDVLTFIRLLSDVASIRYSRDFKKFIVVLKKLLKNKNNNEIFHAALKALANLSAYEKCAEQIQDLNVVSIAEKNCQSQSDIKLLKKIQKNLN